MMHDRRTYYGEDDGRVGDAPTGFANGLMLGMLFWIALGVAIAWAWR